MFLEIHTGLKQLRESTVLAFISFAHFCRTFFCPSQSLTCFLGLWFSVVLDRERHPQCSAWKSTGSVPAHSGGSIRCLDSGQYIFTKTSVNRVRSEGWHGESCLPGQGERTQWGEMESNSPESPFSVSRPSLTTGTVTSTMPQPFTMAPLLLCLSCLQNQYDVDNTHTLLGSAGSTRCSLTPLAAIYLLTQRKHVPLVPVKPRTFHLSGAQLWQSDASQPQAHKFAAKTSTNNPNPVKGKNPGSSLKHFSIVCIILTILIFQAPTKRPLNN